MAADKAPPRERLGATLFAVRTLARAGLAAPGRPDRMVRHASALLRWGTTLAGTLVAAAARDPDRTAILDEDGALTFAEVHARTSRLATAFAGGGRAGVLCRNHRGMVEAMVACGKAGIDVVLLNTGMGADAQRAVVAEQGIDLLVADAEFDAALTGLPESVRRVTAESLDDLVASTPERDLAPPKRPGRTVVLSSGTTGRPKGARRPPRPGLGPLVAILSRIPLRAHDTMLVAAPLFHTWGYAGLQVAMALRATVVLRRRFDPAETLRAVAGGDRAVVFAVPVMARRMVDLPADDLPAVPGPRIVALSGSALPGDLARAFMDTFGDVLYNLYGSTEASWVTIATPEELRANPDTAGLPPHGTRLAILDDDGRLVPAGEPGRIFVANELPFDGYTGGQTKEVRDGMLSLGDVGHVDAEGRLFIDGRDDDMIVSGGENVFPRQVEEVIIGFPEVREVAVLGVADEEFGHRLAAYVVLGSGTELDAEAVRARVRERLARFAVPRDVRFLDELPRNATGKVVPRLLRELDDA